VVLPFYPEFSPGNFKITVPKGGEKLKLLELSKKNAMLFRKDRISQYEKLNPEFRVERLLTQMKQDLRLTELPAHIECFDNSNFHGDYAVSACVVFKDGKPAKKDYRHFNVKTVIGPDDFATMREVISRRYSKVLQEQEPLPQLIVVDGGKGQLSAAVDAMKEVGIYGKVAVIGIAKKLEELFYPEDPVPLHLDKKSETLKIIQQMRDEAHRFGITHHRKRRNKGGLSSELEAIPGIGEESIQLLLRKFKSLKKIREAGMEELSLAIGNARAAIVFNHYHAHHAQD
jgi:excinuclease ABC subunit C